MVSEMKDVPEWANAAIIAQLLIQQKVFPDKDICYLFDLDKKQSKGGYL